VRYMRRAIMDVVSPGEETEDSYAADGDAEHTEDGEPGEAEETAPAESASTKND